MNALIIDNAVLSAANLKCLLKDRSLNAISVSSENLSDTLRRLNKNTQLAIRYIFISVYVKINLSEFVRKLSTDFPWAYIVLVYVKRCPEQIPPSSSVIRDGVLGQPFDKKELDKLLVLLEAR